MSGSATKGHLGKNNFGQDENSGREAISEGGKLEQECFTSSDKAKATPMPRTSFEVACMQVQDILELLELLEISCKALIFNPTP